MRADGSKSRSGKRRAILGADFETDMRFTDDGKPVGFICQWALARARDRGTNKADYTVKHGYTQDEFMNEVYRLMEHSEVKHIIYFHNLRYDLQFMRDGLHDLYEICQEDDEPPVLLFRDSEPIMLRFRNVEFRDSLKKCPNTTVAELGELVSLPKLESPRGNFEPGWSADLTDDDFQYVEHDAAIVALMMKKMHDNGQTGVTISGDAWADIKATFNKTYYTETQDGKHLGRWDEFFPTLTPEMDDWLRPAYYGGLNISWKKGVHRGVDLTHKDRHSMYPSVMRGIASKPSNEPPLLPYGVPVRIPEHVIIDEWCIEHGYPLFVLRGWLKLHLKKGMKPWFKFKNAKDRLMEGLASTDYVTDCRQFHELTLTCTDIRNLERFYILEWDNESEVEGYAFKAKAGLFKEYVDKWYEVKKNAPSGSVERMIAKLMLNSAYGRFGMSRYMTDVAFDWDDDIDDWAFENEEYIADDVKGYLPIALFITAWARWALLDAVLAIGIDRVIHCDTDSVIYIGTEDIADILGSTKELGDWGTECLPVMLVEGGVKRYFEFKTAELRTLHDFAMACSGVPQKQKDGVPFGMWLEILDNPELITDTGYELGKEHYTVCSEWLRNLLSAGGKNPDDMDTRKLISGKSTWIKGGMVLKPTTMKLNDNLRMRFGGR